MIAYLLGLGGIGFGVALVMMPGLRLAISGIIAAIPPKVWIGLAALAVAGGAVWWVSNQIDGARAEGYAQGGKDREAQWASAFSEMQRKAGIYKAGFEQVSREQAAALWSKTDETLRRNSAAADDLRLRGPGAAAAPVCRSGDGAPDRGAADRPGASRGPGDAPLAPVPDNEALAIVPWLQLTRFAEEHDRTRAELDATLEHIDGQNRLFDDLRAKLQAAVPKMPVDRDRAPDLNSTKE